MKTLAILINILLFNCLVYGQTQNKERLINTIDSLNKIISENNSKIDSIKMWNLNLNKQLNNYNSKLNNILLEEQIGDVFICKLETLLYEKPGEFKSLIPVKRGDKVIAVEILDKFYKVYFNGIYGYVYKSGFISESEMIEINKKKDEIAEQQKIREHERIEKEKLIEKQRKLAEENRKKELIRKYGQTDGIKIFQGHIWLGMTKEMVLDSRGKPKDINRTVGSWGVHEQWVYGSQNIYIENGILTSWQD